MLDKNRQSDARIFLDATMYVDFNLYLPDTLMTKTGIAGMTHSLEACMPLLDHPFLEFVATTPPELKLKDGKISKYIFKKAVEPYLPKMVIYRNKMGFGVPIIATDVDPGGMLSQHGCGIACGGDFERFVQNVQRAMTDSQLYANMRAACLQYVKKYHDMEKVIPQYEDVFNKLLRS